MAMENDLGRDEMKKLVLRIAIPSMLAQFVSVLYSVVDRMYIGNIPQIGSMALAGVGVCSPVVTMIGSVAFWVGTGGAPLMSIRMGEGEVEKAKHPYTRTLIDSIFDPKMDFYKKIERIDSEIPSPLDMPPGCPFQTRCESCRELCRKERPVLKMIGEGHEVACHLPDGDE